MNSSNYRDFALIGHVGYHAGDIRDGKIFLLNCVTFNFNLARKSPATYRGRVYMRNDGFSSTSSCEKLFSSM